MELTVKWLARDKQVHRYKFWQMLRVRNQVQGQPVGVGRGATYTGGEGRPSEVISGQPREGRRINEATWAQTFVHSQVCKEG